VEFSERLNPAIRIERLFGLAPEDQLPARCGEKPRLKFSTTLSGLLPFETLTRAATIGRKLDFLEVFEVGF
jgi:hypothetical protein